MPNQDPVKALQGVLFLPEVLYKFNDKDVVTEDMVNQIKRVLREQIVGLPENISLVINCSNNDNCSIKIYQDNIWLLILHLVLIDEGWFKVNSGWWTGDSDDSSDGSDSDSEDDKPIRELRCKHAIDFIPRPGFPNPNGTTVDPRECTHKWRGKIHSSREICTKCNHITVQQVPMDASKTLLPIMGLMGKTLNGEPSACLRVGTGKGLEGDGWTYTGNAHDFSDFKSAYKFHIQLPLKPDVLKTIIPAYIRARRGWPDPDVDIQLKESSNGKHRLVYTSKPRDENGKHYRENCYENELENVEDKWYYLKEPNMVWGGEKCRPQDYKGD